MIVPLFSQKLPPGLSAIDESYLKTAIFELASDEMNGRRAGTLDELRAAVWIAQKAREAGLEPAGDNGTYFQFFSLYRTTVASNNQIKLNGNTLEMWEEVWPTSPIETRLDEDAVWLETYKDTLNNLKDKVVAMKLRPPSRMPAEGMSLWVYRYALGAIREQSAVLKRHGAKAIILVADSTASSQIGFFGHGMEEGKYELQPETEENTVPVFLVAEKFETEFQQEKLKVMADIRVNKFSYPSANILAKAPGRDEKLKNEFVIFSGHHDHDGIGKPVKGDSIWNGADDNASVSVALLAIGKAWLEKPGKRSALFIWHGAEERGLMGSRFFVEHPTIEKEQMVAVLNGDMIGRNTKGKAALLGSIPPHRNSKELVEMAMTANKEITNFEIDTSWDNQDHPEFWYFRSDHLPYARADIPAIFFTSLLHPDYHTPEDEAEGIDINKLTKMTKWMYGTGWKVSENIKKPALEVSQ